ncbi:MAG TPA: hypothetical protein VH912_31440 [Streptosporangiaceae bacterium]
MGLPDPAGRGAPWPMADKQPNRENYHRKRKSRLRRKRRRSRPTRAGRRS